MSTNQNLWGEFWSAQQPAVARIGSLPEKIEGKLWRATNLAGRSSGLVDIVGLLVHDEHLLQLL